MSTDLTYGQVRLLYPVEIDESLSWIENGQPLSIDVQGAYYVYQGSSVSGVDGALGRLLATLAVDMSAESVSNGEGYTYTFARATPSACPQLPYSGLTLTGGALWTSISTGGGATSLLARCLGLVPNTAGAPVGGVWRSARSLYGEWWAPDAPTDLRSARERIVALSTAYPERADFYAVDRGTRRLRTLKWEFIGGAHVWRGRSADAKYAASSGIGIGDDNNALEDLWEAASQGGEILAVYHSPRELPTITRGTRYEVLRLAEEDAYTDFGALLRDRNVGGEFYDLSLPMVQGTSGWDY